MAAGTKTRKGKKARRDGKSALKKDTAKAEAARKARGTSKETVRIHVEPIQTQEFILRIVGIAQLVVHKWGEKPIRDIEAKQRAGNTAKGRSKQREKRDPKAEYEASRYKMSKGKDGFPSCGIKASIVTAGQRFHKIDKVFLRGAFWVEGDLTPINAKPVMERHTVRLSGINRSMDLRYRPVYKNWSMDIRISYDPDLIDPETIVNLANRAGRSVGIGEGRPEKCTLQWGMFKVDLKKSGRKGAA